MPPKTLYRCQSCGRAEPKWLGQCPDCGQWNSFAEERAAPSASSGKNRRSLTAFRSELTPLDRVGARPEARLETSIGEFDRLLGGGLVPGQVLLLAGPPGIGKSTIMLQAAGALALRKAGVLYVSGEESLDQVASRARRLGIRAPELALLCETSLDQILSAAERMRPAVLIVDSIQTTFHPELAGGPGTVGQVRECAAELLRFAKASGATLFLLGHVTKEGSLAGPRVLEHLVDTVLYFETERHSFLRVLRAHKNRFGPTSEIGIFEMRETGLAEVKDAAAFFVPGTGSGLSGRAVSVALEGTRPILAEVQALVSPTRYPLPRRMVTGLDPRRTMLLLAALEKHLRLRLESKDVFVSLAGGLRLSDPALDLAACAAILSSLRETPVPSDLVLVGEVGLLGEIGRVPFAGARLKEAERAGFARALIARRGLKDAAGLSRLKPGGIDTLRDVSTALGFGRPAPLEMDAKPSTVPAGGRALRSEPEGPEGGWEDLSEEAL